MDYKYLPKIDSIHRIFPPCGMEKNFIYDIFDRAFLLDDYTNNLLNWEPPRKGIKFLNNINHTWRMCTV